MSKTERKKDGKEPLARDGATGAAEHPPLEAKPRTLSREQLEVLYRRVIKRIPKTLAILAK